MKTTTDKFTRQDYMQSKCSHREYYAQFVTESIKSTVLSRLSGKDIQEALEKDEHLNSIALPVWDTLSGMGRICNRDLMRELGDTPSIAGGCCIVKEAARQIAEAL